MNYNLFFFLFILILVKPTLPTKSAPMTWVIRFNLGPAGLSGLSGRCPPETYMAGQGAAHLDFSFPSRQQLLLPSLPGSEMEQDPSGPSQVLHLPPGCRKGLAKG